MIPYRKYVFRAEHLWCCFELYPCRGDCLCLCCILCPSFTKFLAFELTSFMCAMPILQVLEALTTTRCNEEFNMEALELFGDSFLKYAVSRKLFVEFKSVNEGILSARRMHRICNKTLHRLAVKRGLTVRDYYDSLEVLVLALLCQALWLILFQSYILVHLVPNLYSF